MATPFIVSPAVQHDVSFGYLICKVPANLTQLFPRKESTKCFTRLKLILTAGSSVCRAATLVQQGEIFQGRNTLAARAWREGRDNFLSWNGLAPFPGEDAAIPLGGFFPSAAHWKGV